MNEVNRKLISHLSQLITKIADGKIKTGNFSMSIQDDAYRLVSQEDGSIKLIRGPVTRSVAFDYTEAE